MVYRMAVLDDDLLELQNTEHILIEYQKEHPEYDINISYYTEAITFLNEVYADKDRAEWAYDILLLDIYLPDGNGIECGRMLREKGFAGIIIYKSSTSENCLEAFEVGALQYLLKPANGDKLFETMDKAVEKLTSECPLWFGENSDCEVQIHDKEEKRRKSVKEFLLEWFHRD